MVDIEIGDTVSSKRWKSWDESIITGISNYRYIVLSQDKRIGEFFKNELILVKKKERSNE